MSQLKLTLPLILILTISFALVFADTSDGITTMVPQNNAQSMPSQITTPAKPIEQKLVENKTSQQTKSQPNISQPTSIVSQIKSIQEQILQQMTSLLHFKSGYLPLDISKKQIVEYSIITAIMLVIIIVIASSARSKNKKPIRK